MDPITPHLTRAERKARRTRIDQQIAASPMRVPAAMRGHTSIFGARDTQ